jgi:putative membrane protein
MWDNPRLLNTAAGALVGIALFVFALAGAYTMTDWWLTRFRIDDDHLKVRQGLVFRTVTEVPLSRLQAVDTVRPLLVQALGLSELRIELAGPTALRQQAGST